MKYQSLVTIAASLLILGAGCSKTNTSEALPIGEYSTYAHSTTDDSLRVNLNTGDKSMLPTMMSVQDSYATVFARSAETQLNIPLGWYGVENGVRTTFMLEDQRTRIQFRIASLEGKTWDTFKETFKENWLKSAGTAVSAENMAINQISDTQFYTVIHHMKTNGESENGIINLVTYQPEYPEFYHSTLLITSDAEVDGYLGLVGLVARDMKIKWDTYE